LKKQSKGVFITNLIDMEQGERVTSIITVKDYERDFLLLATRYGTIKKTRLKEFEEVRRNGKIAMRLDDGDQLVAARLATDATHVVLVSNAGMAIRFKIDDLRDASRTSGGVRGMKLPASGYIVGVETSDDGDQILVITERGFGKRTKLAEYPTQGRGGQGVKTLNITDRTGNVAACRMVHPGQELMLVSKDGIVIRTQLDSISLLGRNTQGVTVMRVGEGDQVASIAAITLQDEKPTRSRAPANPNGHQGALHLVDGNGSAPSATADDDEDEVALDGDGVDDDVIDEPGDEEGDEE
jgi:DNA gyrase subunit A